MPKHEVRTMQVPVVIKLGIVLREGREGDETGDIDSNNRNTLTVSSPGEERAHHTQQLKTPRGEKLIKPNCVSGRVNGCAGHACTMFMVNLSLPSV